MQRSFLDPSFFLRSAPEVAHDMIGTLLMRDDGRVARIVETEAYTSTDEASHTFNGMTERNRVMYGAGGHLYVYFTYGCHFCANVVAGPEGDGSAVLLRAAEPLEGIDLMMQARCTSNVRQLCSGPGKLAQAFGIDKSLYGLDLRATGLLQVMTDDFQGRVVTGPRIGISKAQDTPWRFALEGSAFLSKKI